MIIEQIQNAIQAYEQTEPGPPPNCVVLNPARKHELNDDAWMFDNVKSSLGEVTHIEGARLAWSPSVVEDKFVVLYVKPL